MTAWEWEEVCDGLGIVAPLNACLARQVGSPGGASLLEQGHEQREPRQLLNYCRESVAILLWILSCFGGS